MDSSVTQTHRKQQSGSPGSRRLRATFCAFSLGLLLSSVLFLQTALREETAVPQLLGGTRTLKDRDGVVRKQQQEKQRLTTSFTYDPTNATDPRPRNLRLVFIGDSVTRYQYIALVYFLKTGEWLTDAVDPNPLYFGFYSNRGAFFRESNVLLQPQEQCDCGMQKPRNNSTDFRENRYFADPERGNYVVFICKFGSKPTIGNHWWPRAAAQLAAVAANDATTAVGTQQNVSNATAATAAGSSNKSSLIYHEWFHATWSDTISKHAATLKPKPDFLIFNAGLHPHDLRDANVRSSIVGAAQAAGIVPIYKTTTYMEDSAGVADYSKSAHDEVLCGSAVAHCLDLGWLGNLTGKRHNYDGFHFKPHVNKRMNLQMLAYLQMIQLSRSGENYNATARFGGPEWADNIEAPLLVLNVTTLDAHRTLR